MNKVVVNKYDNGKSFDLLKGDTLVIEIPEIPTTGYKWEIEEIDNKVIEFSESIFSISLDSGIGGGGLRKYYFKILSSGMTKIQLSLRRKWESDNSAVDKFEINICIK